MKGSSVVINDRLVYHIGSGLYYILAVPYMNFSNISCHDCIIWRNDYDPYDIMSDCDNYDSKGEHVTLCNYPNHTDKIDHENPTVCIDAFIDLSELNLFIVSYIKCKK